MTYLFITGYLLLLIGIMYKSYRANRTAKEYISAKNSLGVFDIAASATAGVLDVASVFVLFGATLLFGAAGVGIWLAYLVATILIAILTPYFYDAVAGDDAWTFSDFFRVRFGKYTEKTFGIISSLYVLGLIVGIYSINLVLFAKFLDVGTYWATIISFAITMIYVLVGGFRGLVNTDIIQYVIMLVFLTAAAIFFPEAEGATASFEVSSMFTGAFLMLVPVIFFQNMVKPAAWQPIIGAKNKSTAIKGMWLAVVLNALVVVPLVWVSLSYAQLLPDSVPTEVLIDALGTVLPGFLTPVVFIGLLAALMSSLDSALFFIGTNVTHNLIPKRFSESFGELKLVRVVIVLVSLFAVLLSILVPDFVTLVFNLMPLMGVVALPFFIGLFVSGRGFDLGTAIAMVCGALSFAYMFVNPPAQFIWNLIPIVVSGVVCIGFWLSAPKSRV